MAACARMRGLRSLVFHLDSIVCSGREPGPDLLASLHPGIWPELEVRCCGRASSVEVHKGPCAALAILRCLQSLPARIANSSPYVCVTTVLASLNPALPSPIMKLVSLAIL